MVAQVTTSDRPSCNSYDAAVELPMPADWFRGTQGASSRCVIVRAKRRFLFLRLMPVKLALLRNC
jgi:hypothetical protein